MHSNVTKIMLPAKM